MSLPYENATSGSNAINDIQKMLRAFGCQRFAIGEACNFPRDNVHEIGLVAMEVAK